MPTDPFFTLAVHAGEDRAEHFGAASVPIYTASVFAFADADEGVAIHNEEQDGYYYGRLGNPTTAALERTIAELEGGEAGLCFASGMAAISAAIVSTVGRGGHIVAPESMYSTTTNLLRFLSDQFDIVTTFVDATNAENYEAAVKPETKVFWVETPSNPLVRITDIRCVTEIASEHKITTIADNTFASPYIQQPISLGVDIVVHSATKYLGGHSDLTAGLLVTTSERASAIYKSAVKLLGGTIAPQVAWLVLRGIKTLALRMERHNANAFGLANMLQKHPFVSAVHYPGLESHPNHEIARRQMQRGFGGVIGLDVGSAERAKSLVNRVKLCTFATSLGGVETIIQPSALMTHATLSPEQRAAAGIGEGLLRLSVGIEDVEDIYQDLVQALEQ